MDNANTRVIKIFLTSIFVLPLRGFPHRVDCGTHELGTSTQLYLSFRIGFFSVVLIITVLKNNTCSRRKRKAQASAGW